MARWVYEQKGLTIIEVLLGVVIMVLILGGTLAIFSISITAFEEGSAEINLQRNASIAMEKMVRGVVRVSGRDPGIREAVSVSISSGNNRIDFTSNDGDTRAFALAGTELRYYPDSDLSGYSVIAEDVADLDFAGTHVISIDLKMQNVVRDKTIGVDLSTQVKLRN